jgi:hypothetical protein
VIVVLAAQLTIKALPDAVHVVARRTIARSLIGRPIRLRYDDVTRIFEQARRSTVWQPGG